MCRLQSIAYNAASLCQYLLALPACSTTSPGAPAKIDSPPANLTMPCLAPVSWPAALLRWICRRGRSSGSTPTGASGHVLQRLLESAPRREVPKLRRYIAPAPFAVGWQA
jgi:hypothetical protein